MVLSGKQIIEEVRLGNIHIDDFDPLKINPNSYNLTLGGTLAVYECTIHEWVQRVSGPGGMAVMLDHPILMHYRNDRDRLDQLWREGLDMAKENTIFEYNIPVGGEQLLSDFLYLGRTAERTITKIHAPMLEGRSSTGRLGLQSHICAGVGDVGFDGAWTLEISVLHNLRVYAGVDICQIVYHKVEGELTTYASGKYQGNNSIQGSRMYRDKFFNP